MAEGCESNMHNNNANKTTTYLGDSWFASIPTCVKLKQQFNVNFICIIKTNHAWYPKAFLNKVTEEWPDGSSTVLEATVENTPILAIGYKYNSKKTQCFVCTKGAGGTENGISYVAKWKDKNNNTCTHNIPCPAVVSKYYTNSNIIDVHNQSRQGDLQLEKHWVTGNGFFRLVTMLFGMLVTNCWNAYKHHLNFCHCHKHIGIVNFASILACDCLSNTCSTISIEDQALVITVSSSTFAASIALPIAVLPSPVKHCLVENTERYLYEL